MHDSEGLSRNKSKEEGFNNKTACQQVHMISGMNKDKCLSITTILHRHVNLFSANNGKQQTAAVCPKVYFTERAADCGSLNQH